MKSQKVFSLRRQLMRPPSVAKGDISLGVRRKRWGEEGEVEQTNPPEAGRGKWRTQRVMSLLLN